MKAVFKFLIALMGCLHLCGGHYGVLQGLAWTQMIISYSAESGWIEGARQTFDGEHPCDLCVAIADAKQKDSDPANHGPQRRGIDSGLELKPCPLSSPLVIAEPALRNLPLGYCRHFLTLKGSLPSGPEPPPPRVV